MKKPMPVLPKQRPTKPSVSQNKAASCTIAAVTLIIGILGGSGAQADEKPKNPTQTVMAGPALAVDFSKIQSECVQVAGLEIGNQAHWKGCRLMRAGFVGTIDLQDFYYANYCLTKVGKQCAAHAQLLFSNRAYRPEARLQSLRIDPAGTQYDAPLMIGSHEQSLLASTVYHKGQTQAELDYSVWLGVDWIRVDTKSWHQALPQQLPNGIMVRLSPHAQPDPKTMSMHLPLFQKGQHGTWIALRSDVQLTFTVEGTRLMASTMTVTNTDITTTVLPQTARSAVPSIKPLVKAHTHVSSRPKDQQKMESLSNREDTTPIF